MSFYANGRIIVDQIFIFLLQAASRALRSVLIRLGYVDSNFNCFVSITFFNLKEKKDLLLEWQVSFLCRRIEE